MEAELSLCRAAVCSELWLASVLLVTIEPLFWLYSRMRLSMLTLITIIVILFLNIAVFK